MYVLLGMGICVVGAVGLVGLTYWGNRHNGRRNQQLLVLMQEALNGDLAALKRINTKSWSFCATHPSIDDVNAYLARVGELTDWLESWRQTLRENGPELLVTETSRIVRALQDKWDWPAEVTASLEDHFHLSVTDCLAIAQRRLDVLVAVLLEPKSQTYFGEALLVHAAIRNSNCGLIMSNAGHWNDLVAQNVVSPSMSNFEYPEGMFVETLPSQLAAVALRTEDLTLAKMVLAKYEEWKMLNSWLCDQLAVMVDRLDAERRGDNYWRIAISRASDPAVA